jgi:hypothetical protein
MRLKIKFLLPLFCLVVLLSSCESEVERKQRLAREEQQKIELEVKLEKERQEQIVYNKYIDNSLSNGATPYAYCFGANYSCSEWGCAGISVKTPYNSDVLVTIKENNIIVRHAYIPAGNTYDFQFPNGTYQAFFYYGKGWNPNRIMKELDCGILKGGFVAEELFSKDAPQILNNSILSYELILQQSGNFSTKPSNIDEVF